MENKTQSVKVTLRPSHIKKVKKLAKEKFEDNFSMALRFIVDSYKGDNNEKRL